MIHKVDVIVVGAGLIGAAFALYLAKHSDLQIALVERAEAMPEVSGQPEQDNQRVVALGKTATTVLSEVGVFDLLGRHLANPYQRMFVWDEHSNGELEFDASDVDASELGFMVDALACTRALQLEASSGDYANLHCYFGVESERLLNSNGYAELHTSKGLFTAPLLIGVDGGNSWVRHQVQIFSNRRTYQQQGIVAKIRTEKPHRDCAWQRFLQTGPVAVLPLADNYSSIVWSAEQGYADELMSLNDADFQDALSHALQQRLGAITEVSARQAFPLSSQRAQSYYSSHVALAGDAAHSIHPLAGQGANLGFKDLRCLAQIIIETPISKLGQPSVLQRYQTQRKQDNEQTDALMSALHSIYQLDNPLWFALRGWGMSRVSSSAILRKILAEQAVGFSAS